MSALETLIAAADGTTGESMHVCVPVNVIRELAEEFPAHVQQANLDADIRQAAIDGSISILVWNCPHVVIGQFNTARLWPSDTKARRARVDRALRILRHFGLLVEHGDGVVSIRERT